MLYILIQNVHYWLWYIVAYIYILNDSIKGFFLLWESIYKLNITTAADVFDKNRKGIRFTATAAKNVLLIWITNGISFYKTYFVYVKVQRHGTQYEWSIHVVMGRITWDTLQWMMKRNEEKNTQLDTMLDGVHVYYWG